MTELEMNLMRRATLGDGLRRSSLRHPDKAALIYYYVDGRSTVYSYRDLNEKANRVANSLLAMGVRKGDRVAAISHNSPELVMLIYALLKIGAWYTPLNFMLQGADIARLVDFAGARLLFVGDNLTGTVSEVVGDLASVDKVVLIDLTGGRKPDGWLDFNTLMDAPAGEPGAIIDDEDVATLFFTSGTEAAPKGVLSTHRNYYASHLAYIINVSITPEDVLLVSIPLIHMAGFDFLLIGHILSQTVVVTQLPNPSQMLDLIEKHRVSATALPPTLYLALARQPDFTRRDLTSARSFLTWASTIPRAMVEAWNEVAPNLEFFTLQGSSESTATAITGSFFKTWADVPNEDGRWVGKAMAFGSELRLVDDDDRDVPVGQPGEQVIRGPVVMKGYYRNERENDRVFRGGWFHTGDILFRDAEGNYFFADRKKDMIKTGEENVFSQEVENVIGAHPAVMQCAVFGVPDPRWGEAVTAAIVPRAGVTVTEEEIIGFCHERLPGFKVPKYVVVTDSLPTTAAGKLLKRDLKAAYAGLAEERGKGA